MASESVDQNVILAAGADIADGKFEIVSLISTGATSTVYRARHRLLGMDVALKLLNFSLLGRDDCLARFQKEARVSSQLIHSNLARLIGYGTLDDGRPFLAIELIEGRTLSEILIAEELQPERAIGFFLQICDGLEALHRNGIIHRDLKPGNIMVSSDGAVERLKIIDLGLIKELQSSDPKITKTGQILGSTAYMSPEQCRSEKIDERSDIYSFGCLMYECLAGTPPFGHDAGFVTMTKQITEAPPPISCFRKLALPPGLESIVRLALEKDASKRYQNISELRDHLRRCLDGELSSKFMRVHSLERRGTKSGGVIGAAICAVICFMAVIGFFIADKAKHPSSATEIVQLAPKKIDQKQLLNKARRMAQAAALAPDWQIQSTLRQTEVMMKYYDTWLEIHPNAELLDKAKAEYQLFIHSQILANQKLANEHEKKAERFYLQLLNEKIKIVEGSQDKSSYDYVISATIASNCAKALGDLSVQAGRPADAVKYHSLRWKFCRLAQPSGSEESNGEDLIICKTLHALEAYGAEEAVLRNVRFGLNNKPVWELVFAHPPDLLAFSFGPQGVGTRMIYLSALYRNQDALGNESNAAKVYAFMTSFASTVISPFDKALAYQALAGDAQKRRQFDLAIKYADIVLSSLSRLPDQNRRELVECKLATLVLAGSTSQILNRPAEAAKYYSACLPYSGHRHYDGLVLQCLREYFITAISLRDQKLCDQLIEQYRTVAESRDDRAQDQIVLGYFRLKRLSLSPGDHHKEYSDIVNDVVSVRTSSRQSCLSEQIAVARALAEMRQLELAERLLKHVTNTYTAPALADFVQTAKIILAGVKAEMNQYEEALELLAGINRSFGDPLISIDFQMQRAIIGLTSSIALGRDDLIKHYSKQGAMLLNSECLPEGKAGFLVTMCNYYASRGQTANSIAAARRALAFTKEYCSPITSKMALLEILLAKQLINTNQSESANLFKDAVSIAKSATDAPADGSVETAALREYEAAKKIWASKK